MAVMGKVGSLYPGKGTMSRLFSLTSEQPEVIRPNFSLLHGMAHGLRVISGIISVPLLPGCFLQMGDS